MRRKRNSSSHEWAPIHFERSSAPKGSGDAGQVVSLQFYFDQHMPEAIAAGLRRRGIEVLTAADDGAERLPDDQLLVRATQLKRVLVTMDQDFLQIAEDCWSEHHAFGGIVVMTSGRMTIGQVIEELELIAQVFVTEEFQNRLQRLPL